MISDSVINVAMLNSKILGNNIMDSYIPFVSTLICSKHYNKVKIETLCSDFLDKYGFEIPPMPMNEILSRMQRKKMIKKDAMGNLFPVFDSLYETDFEKEYKETLIKYENILNRFIICASEKYNIDVNLNKAEKCFKSFIEENYIETIMLDNNVEAMMNALNTSQTENEMFYFKKFVIDLYKNDYDSFKIIQNFCMGYIVANTLSISNISTNNISFKNKKVFFDTNFMLRLMGIEGEFYEEAYNGLITTLKQNGCKLYVLSHIFDEIVNILGNARKNILNGMEISSNVQRYFYERSFTDGDMKLLISTFENKMKKLGIYISNLSYDNTQEKYQIDEEKLYQEIICIYTKNNTYFDENQKSEMIWNDVKSISLIYRDIRGNRAYSINNLGDVLITTNKALVYACKNFEKNESKKDNTIVPCMNDVFLGTLLWIQSPMQYEEYNEKLILACCYSSIRVDSRELNKFYSEVEKLKDKQEISEDDYLLLREHDVVEDMLSDKVLGNNENIDEKMPYEIIAEIKNKVTKGYRDEIQNKDNALQKKEEIIKEKDRIIEDKDKRYDELKKKVEGVARKKAIIATIIFYVVITICILAIIIDLVFNIAESINGKYPIVRIIAFMILAISAVLSYKESFWNYSKYWKKVYEKECRKWELE